MNPPLPPSNDPVIGFLSAFSTFSPTSRSRISGFLAPSSNAPPMTSAAHSVIPRKLFDSASERPDDGTSAESGFGIHPSIVKLAANHIPISLVMFTTKSTNQLHRQYAGTRMLTTEGPDGRKIHIIDTSEFGDPLTLSPGTWHEAWQRRLDFIEKFYDLATLIRWRSHYMRLTREENFEDNFDAIRFFDHQEYTSWSLDPRQFNESAYLARFDKVKLHILRSEVRSARDSSASCGPDRHPRSSSRYDPVGSKSSSSRSNFHDSPDSHDSSRPPSSPLCLCCKRVGHKFSGCAEKTSSTGGETYSHYTDKKLAVRSSSAPLCITFQLQNPKRVCKVAHPEQHLCSFCGSPDHGACSRKC